MSGCAVTGDRCAICGRKFGPVGTVSSLNGERRKDGEDCPPVDEPFDF